MEEEARIYEAYQRRKASGKRYFHGSTRATSSWRKIWSSAYSRRSSGTAWRRCVRNRYWRSVAATVRWLREFIKWGARPENLAGVDLLADRIAQACRLGPPGVVLACGNAAQLDFADGSFDIVLQATVFTSILDVVLKKQVADEMVRVLKPDGVVLWYDFRVNNPRNPDVRGIERAEIERLFSNCRVTLKRITLAPPLLRALAPYSWLGSYLLSSIPWACSHYLGTIQKLR
ncbi:MAG: class I SAM-dependent methyltransferase [Candidatus Binatia bacterium]